MTRLSAWKMASALFLLWATTGIASSAQTFTTLVNFGGGNGSQPAYASLVQGVDGKLYGTTMWGGVHDEGTVFGMTTGGLLTPLYSFCSQFNCADGEVSLAGLTLGANGNFYGTTEIGGANGNGTFFEIDPAGQLSTLDSFESMHDGKVPVGTLIQGVDHNFYGTMAFGGTNQDGTVFKISPKGMFSTLYTFGGADGASPQSGLVQGSDGYLYGTTYTGGDLSCNPPNGCGTVFKITCAGKLTTLYKFSSSDGAYAASLIEGSDGMLYGTTGYGGANNNGTVFKMSVRGVLTTLHSFSGTDGAYPYGVLVQATDGNFYGTTYGGGVGQCTGIQGCGTVFAVTPRGALAVLHTFCGQDPCVDGGNPIGGMVQATDGNLYGMASGNRAGNNGTVYRLSLDLTPIVEFVRRYGKVGQTGGILGQGFTGTTSVSLNGIPASFTVVSDTFIRATVPPSATTGYVQVVTPSGTLTSNVPFHVIP